MKIHCAKLVMILLLWPMIASGQEIEFSRFLPPIALQKSIDNAAYLAKALQKMSDAADFSSNLIETRLFLYRELKQLTHYHNRLPCSLSAEPESILWLSSGQLIRVYLIYNALKNGDLVEQIAGIIDRYKEGDFFEPGGLGLIEDGQIVLEPLPSDPWPRTPGTESVYIIPEEGLKRQFIFLFHLHPLSTSGPLTGPSWSVKIDKNTREAKLGNDIGATLSWADDFGDSHHLLISKMYNRAFNVDYYSAEKQVYPPVTGVLDYCPRLKGFKIVDLGKWSY
jgi:hypothetical protein